MCPETMYIYYASIKNKNVLMNVFGTGFRRAMAFDIEIDSFVLPFQE